MSERKQKQIERQRDEEADKKIDYRIGRSIDRNTEEPNGKNITKDIKQNKTKKNLLRKIGCRLVYSIHIY